MKRYPQALSMLLIVSGIPVITYAHPYDSPLTFEKHTSSNGGIVYSNIPHSCFKSGLMTCWHYHPVSGKEQHDAASRPESSVPTPLTPKQ